MIIVEDELASQVCGRCGDAVGPKVDYSGAFVEIGDARAIDRPA
jgi:hypothetical protein